MGIAVFALTRALMAARKGMDPFAVDVAGFVAAITLRALAISRGWPLPAFPARD